MSTTTTRQLFRRYLTGIAAVTLASTGLLAAPPATATQNTGDGGSGTRVVATDIVDVVTARKIAMAQDRIDRAWMYPRPGVRGMTAGGR